MRGNLPFSNKLEQPNYETEDLWGKFHGTVGQMFPWAAARLLSQLIPGREKWNPFTDVALPRK